MKGAEHQPHQGRHEPIRPPEELPAIPNAKPIKSKAYVQGGGVQRRRYTDGKHIYEWDSRHGTVEKYSWSGKKHLGEFDPLTGQQIKAPDPKRKIEK